jgi:hypothetical protein
MSIMTGAEHRKAIRTAINAHPDGKAWMAANGLNMAVAKMSDLRKACEALGIDPATGLRFPSFPPKAPAPEAPKAEDYNPEHHKPRPHSAESVNALAGKLRFWRENGLVSDKDHEFILSVLRTITAKQDGRATEKQWGCLTRILANAERSDENRRRMDGERKAPEAPKAENTPKTPAKPQEAPMNAQAPTITPDAQSAATDLAKAIAAIAGGAVNRETVLAIVKEEVARAMGDAPATIIEVRKGGDLMGRVEGTKHPMFQTLLRAAAARLPDGYAPNIWIAGPAGSGKTTAARMAATALGTRFLYNGALGMSHEVLGFVDAGGNYHGTAFRDAFENGGLHLFDEVDGSDNAPLLAINGPLANNLGTFPDKQVVRHEDAIFLAAANTFGAGATAEYVGRARIDAAFLDRFAVKLSWGYDEVMEREISPCGDFARRVQRARAKAQELKLKVIISPRASIVGGSLIKGQGFTPDEAALMTYLATMTQEQREMMRGY